MISVVTSNRMTNLKACLTSWGCDRHVLTHLTERLHELRVVPAPQAQDRETSAEAESVCLAAQAVVEDVHVVDLCSSSDDEVVFIRD